MQKNKLAIIAGSDMRSFGGGEKYIIELVKRLRGFDITVYSCRDDNTVRISNEEINKMLQSKLIYFKAIHFIKDNIPLTKSGLRMLKDLANYDTIYVTDSSPFMLLPVLLFKGRARLIFGVHNPEVFRTKPHSNKLIKRLLFKIYRFITMQIILHIPNIHVLNIADRNALEAQGYKGNLYLIPNFIYYNQADIQIKIPPKFIVLFGGRLEINQKGIDLLAEIIEKTLSKNKNIEFHIFGSGEGKKFIEPLISKYPKNVYYLGFISNEKLKEEYENAMIYIMTSRYESFGLVVLEAQAFGLPVITFDISGPNEIIKKSFQGSLIEPFDTNLFSEQILKYYDLWKSGNLNKNSKLKIRDYIFSQYSGDIIIPKLEKILGV